MASARWVEVTVQVDPVDVEPVASLLGELAPSGVAIEPAFRVLDSANFGYELLDGRATVRACFPAPLESSVRRALRRRLTALPLVAPLPRLRFADVPDRDWSEEWKRHFRVLHVGRRLVVRPSWEAYRADPGEVVIELDPGSAFGTGQHATTRLCLSALDRHLREGDAVIDVGAGSGLLAIAAARLGAGSVRALDIDAATLPIARENVERNGVASVIDVAEGSLGELWPWTERARGSADLVVMNISSTVLPELLPAAAAALRPGGRFIGSGFIDANAGAVETAVIDAGLRVLGTQADEEWRCIVAVASGAP